MNYYKMVTIIALVVLIICLAFVGAALSKSSKNSIFPPQVSECPDFYVKDELTGNCETDKYDKISDECYSINFSNDTEYNNPGMGSTSGMCKKKNWAKGCNINWDGITNNPDVCYRTNS